MKIATWNLERPAKRGRKTNDIIAFLKELNADILVLTETNEFIDLGSDYNVYHSSILTEKMYKLGERRVSIFSKFPLATKIKSFQTFDAETAICINLKTPLGELAVYGTVLGVLGNKGQQFKSDLEKQLLDFERLNDEVDSFCIIGDLNMSFLDNYYFTKEGREKLNSSFIKHRMKNCTAEIKNNIDHIVVSEFFLDNRKFVITYWNETENKQTRLSDHLGVMIEIFC